MRRGGPGTGATPAACPAAMEDDPAEALTDLRERAPGLLELLQAAAGSGLAAYAVWAALLQPGFRRVPLRLQVRGGGAREAGRAAGSGDGYRTPPASLPRCLMSVRVCGRWSTCCRCCEAVLEKLWTWAPATAGL